MVEGEGQFGGMGAQRYGDPERSCFLGHVGPLPCTFIRGHRGGRHALSSDYKISNEMLLETLGHLWSRFPSDWLALITSSDLFNLASGVPCFPPTPPLSILTAAPGWDLDLGGGLGPRGKS